VSGPAQLRAMPNILSRTLACTLACWAVGSATALAQGLDGVAREDDIVLPQYDASVLPPLGPGWRERNPYRDTDRTTGSVEIVTQGRRIFNQSCARCHGVDASGLGPAPDLRRIGLACRRVPEPELQARCEADADHHFLSSVRHGKVRVGITHMPPWEKALSQEAIWALRSFVEQAPATKR
jgi:cytochrome c553